MGAWNSGRLSGMHAKRLLELNEEFAAVDAEYSRSIDAGEPEGRTKEEIAEEYGVILRQFLNGPAS